MLLILREVVLLKFAFALCVLADLGRPEGNANAHFGPLILVTAAAPCSRFPAFAKTALATLKLIFCCRAKERIANVSNRTSMPGSGLLLELSIFMYRPLEGP
jgi:hypothetical protein